MAKKTWVIKLGGAVLNTENAARALFDVLSNQPSHNFVIEQRSEPIGVSRKMF